MFSGIFYIETLTGNHQLRCHFKDEDSVVHNLNITHFQSPDLNNHPFPDAFQTVQSGSVCFITGTFAIHNKTDIMVLPYKCK